MRKILLILGGFTASLYNAQNVGINTSQPTATLDVNGTGKYRALPNANTDASYTRTIVTDQHGNLGYKNINKALLVKRGHYPRGLFWNTRELDATRNGNHTVGPQSHVNFYMVFGRQKEAGWRDNTRGYTDANTTFTAAEGDVLNINSLITFQVVMNVVGSKNSNPLNTISPNGDRQVIFHLNLYKGNRLLKKVKQIVVFNGRNDGVTGDEGYEPIFSRSIDMVYVVPKGASGSDYSISLAVSSLAPRDGNFRVLLDAGDRNSFLQYLTVSK